MPPSLFSSIAFIFFFFFFSSTARIEKPTRSSVLKKFHSKISKQVDDAVKPRPSSPEEAADDPAAAADDDDDAGALLPHLPSSELDNALCGRLVAAAAAAAGKAFH